MSLLGLGKFWKNGILGQGLENFGNFMVTSTSSLQNGGSEKAATYKKPNEG